MSAPDLTRLEEGQVPWGIGRVPAWCEGCSRTWLVREDQLGNACGCGVGELQASAAAVPEGGPEGLLPVQVGRAQLKDALSKHFAKVKWRDKDVRPAALAERAVRIWWPRYLIDSDVDGSFQVEVGYDYEAHSTVESYKNGRWVTEQRVEWRVRWEQRVGQLRRRYNNIVADAIRDQDRLPGGSRLDQEMTLFDGARVGDDPIQVPDLGPSAAWPDAEPTFRRLAGDEVQKAVQGQHVREVHLNAEHPNQHWTMMLQPMWMTWYRTDKGEVLPLVVDGLSGDVVGAVLAGYTWAIVWGSVIGVAGGLLLLLCLVTAVICIFIPPLIALPILCFVFGVIGLGFSVAPTFSVRGWNRKQRALAKELRRQDG